MDQEQPPQYVEYPRGPQGPGGQGWVRPPEVRLDVLGEGINLFTRAPKLWAVACLPSAILMAIATVISLFVQGLGNNPEWIKSIGPSIFPLLFGYLGLSIVGSILLYIQLAGITQMGIRMLRGEEVVASDVWKLSGKTWDIIASAILVGIAACFGVIGCIVGVYFVMGISLLVYPLIMDQGMNAVEAISTSWRTLRPFWFMSGVLAFLVYLILGFSPYLFLVGLLFGIPFTSLTLACLYRDFYPQLFQPR